MRDSVRVSLRPSAAVKAGERAFNAEVMRRHGNGLGTGMTGPYRAQSITGHPINETDTKGITLPGDQISPRSFGPGTVRLFAFGRERNQRQPRSLADGDGM